MQKINSVIFPKSIHQLVLELQAPSHKAFFFFKVKPEYKSPLSFL